MGEDQVNIEDIVIGQKYVYRAPLGGDRSRDNSIVTADYHNGRQVRIKFSDSLGIDVDPSHLVDLHSTLPLPPVEPVNPLYPSTPEVVIQPQTTATNTANPVMSRDGSGWVEVDTEVLDWLNRVANNLSIVSALSTDKGTYELPDHIDIIHNDGESGFRLSYDGDADKYVVMVKR